MPSLAKMGPQDDTMTGPDGREMSDHWQEAQVIKAWVEEIWEDLEGVTDERFRGGVPKAV